MLKRKIERIYAYAITLQRQFGDNLKMLENTHYFRAPGLYNLTAEQFAARLVEVRGPVRNGSMVAFITQALVETSPRLTKKVNRIFEWIDRRVAEINAAREQEQATKAVEPPAPVPQYPLGRTQPVNLNRRQRRRMQRMGQKK